jgi:hypothetical protein
MPAVLYRAYDLLTRAEIDDVPLYGVSLTMKLNESGTFTGSCRLDDERKPGAQILEATRPGRTLLVPEIEGIPLSSYIIWARTYQSSGRTIQLYGETLDSYAKQRINSTDRVFTNVDSRNIAVALWNAIQSDPHGNIGLIMPSAPTNSFGLTTLKLNGYEYDGFAKVIDDLATDITTGFDYYVQTTRSGLGVLQTRLILDHTVGMSATTSQLTFAYPGAIRQFWLPENASAGATRLYGIGAGDGAEVLKTSVAQTSTDLLDAGYPLIEDVYPRKDIKVKNTVAALTTAELRRRRIPVGVPTFDVDPTADPQFGNWALGDFATWDVQDPRYPDGFKTQQRIIGWTYTPSSSEGPPALHMALQGEDDTAVE